MRAPSATVAGGRTFSSISDTETGRPFGLVHPRLEFEIGLLHRVMAAAHDESHGSNTAAVHVWHIDLDAKRHLGEQQPLVLSPDERIRANRFRFAIHRDRFIACRTALRVI